MKKMKKFVAGGFRVIRMSDLALMACVALMAGCSSAPKPEPQNEAELKPVPDYEGPGYITRVQYPKEQPKWSEDFEKFKRNNDGKGTTYFMGESGDVNDRVAGCELAGLMAKRRISDQIAQKVMSKIGSAKTGTLALDKDSRAMSSLGSDFQDMVASESTAFLIGVQEYGKFWEERDYTPSGGRRRVYECQVIVTMDDAHLKDAIRRIGQTVRNTVSDNDAKNLVDSAFKKLEEGTEGVSLDATAKDAEKLDGSKNGNIKTAKAETAVADKKAPVDPKADSVE